MGERNFPKKRKINRCPKSSTGCCPGARALISWARREQGATRPAPPTRPVRSDWGRRRASASAILVLRSTACHGRRADARGASGLRTLFRLHFTLFFTNFHVFYFLPLIFFYPKILCQNISPSFLSQNLLMDFFGS